MLHHFPIFTEGKQDDWRKSMKELKKQLKKSKKVKESKGSIQSKPIISKPNAAETRNVKSLIEQTRQLLSVLNPSEEVDSVQRTTAGARSKLLASRRDCETEGAAARPGSSSSGSYSDSISILGDEIESLVSSPDTSFIAKEKPGPLHSGNLFFNFYFINHWKVFFFFFR